MRKPIVFLFILAAVALMFTGCTAKQAMLNKQLAPKIEENIRADKDLGKLLDNITWERGVLQFNCKKDSKVGITGAFAMAERIVRDFMMPVHEEADSHPGQLRANVAGFEMDRVDEVSGTGTWRVLASATYNFSTKEWERKRYGMSGL